MGKGTSHQRLSNPKDLRPSAPANAAGRHRTDAAGRHTHTGLLMLQRTLGNRAVTELLTRSGPTLQRAYSPALVNSKAHLRPPGGGVVGGYAAIDNDVKARRALLTDATARGLTSCGAGHRHPLSAESVLDLQRGIGNRSVACMLASISHQPSQLGVRALTPVTDQAPGQALVSRDAMLSDGRSKPQLPGRGGRCRDLQDQVVAQRDIGFEFQTTWGIQELTGRKLGIGPKQYRHYRRQEPVSSFSGFNLTADEAQTPNRFRSPATVGSSR